VFSSGKEVENARESGIEFPREKNPDKWNSEALLYDGRFKEADQIGIFYGAPFNDDEITKEQYRNLKQKLLDTNFLGTDAKKRTTFVKAMEKGIELMLGMEELKKIDTSPSTGPERLINKNTGNELNL
jgi:hypothetical protein